GSAPFTFQWFSNNVEIAEATGPVYTITNTPLSANNAKFKVAVSNGTGSITSSEATLTVTADTTKPTIASASGTATRTEAVITFSEPISDATLGNAGNYSLSGGLTISAATVVNPNTVRLTTSKQTDNTPYTVTVNNLLDTAATPNAIAPNSTA